LPLFGFPSPHARPRLNPSEASAAPAKPPATRRSASRRDTLLAIAFAISSKRFSTIVLLPDLSDQ